MILMNILQDTSVIVCWFVSCNTHSSF